MLFQMCIRDRDRTKGTINIMDCITAPGGTAVSNPSSSPTRTFEFNYYDITPGATIDIFSNDGLIADQVPNPRTSVTLKFVGDLGLIVGNPDATPGFVIFTGKIEGDVDENNPAP